MSRRGDSRGESSGRLISETTDRLISETTGRLRAHAAEDDELKRERTQRGGGKEAHGGEEEVEHK